MRRHRAWDIGVDGYRMRDPDASVCRGNMWPEFCVFDTVRDKTAANFGLTAGMRVQSVVTRKRVRANGKATSARRLPVTPWNRDTRGIHDETLADILLRRSLFGGRKGASAIRRLRELNRQWLADERYLRAET